MGNGERTGSSRRRQRIVLMALLGAVTLFALGVTGAHGAGRRHAGAAAARAVQTADKLVTKIKKSYFARGHRHALLVSARRAARLARKRKACRALVATDAFLNSLANPTSWRKHRPPRRPVRRPLALLARAERILMRHAGGRCAKPTSTRRLLAHRGGGGSPKVQPPNANPDQGDGVDRPIPLGKLIRPKSIGGGSGLGADPHGGSPAVAGGPLARIASGPLSFFRNADLGPIPFTAKPREETAAVAPGAGVAWYTGNTWDGLSTDAGRTWTRFDPSSILPDQGLAFCCDQLVSYSPSYNLFVWVSQYWCNEACLAKDKNGNSVCRSDHSAYNRIRIAVASPEDLRANSANPGAAWTYWDVTPQTIGEPLNAWFDRSDMSVNAWNFNWGVDILCGNQDQGGNLVARISLAQLAARGSVTLSYITDNGGRTTAQGLGNTTTYFAGNESDSQSEIWSWAPFSGTLFRHDINHSSVPIFDNAINGSNGVNWYDRYGIFPGEVESATVSGNTLYLAQGTGRAYCTANCSTNSPTLNHVFNEPAILITKFDTNTWSEVGERWIWNPTLAFGWPALQTDGAGDVGLAFRASSDQHNAQPVAGFLTPSEQFYWTDPEGGPFETGDYYSLRPGRTSQSFVMTGETVESGTMHWSYIEYGLGSPPYVAPPNVHITSPSNFSQFGQGTTASYSADVSDPIDGTLPSGAIVWTEDGSQIGTGSTITHAENNPGLHTIKVTATNGDGKSASDQITIRVQPPAAPGSPSVSISSPQDNSLFCAGTPSNGNYYASVQFQASANDPNNPPLTLTYSWTDSIDGGQATTVSTQLSPELLLQYNTGDSETTHDLTLTATNSNGKSNSAQVRVNVYNPGCLG